MRIDADILIPGRGDPIEQGSVVLSGSTIIYAGPTAAAPADDEVVHVPAVMPGMWECHAHFTGMIQANLEHDAAEHAAVKAARAVPDLEATLMGGITSAREPGGLGIYLRHAVDEGRILGPTIYSAGGVLSTTGGHADVHGFPLDWVMSDHAAPIGVMCDGVPEVLKAVRTQLRKGAALIKVCASGGVLSELDHPIHQQFSAEELRAIVEEAGRAERAVAAHCHGKPGIMAALEAGAATIEHGSYLDDEAAEKMVETGAVFVPTRFILVQLMEMEDRIPAYAFRKARLVADHHALALKTAVANGVTIATGTDIFLSGTDQGRNSLEVKHLIDSGMTPLQAIEAATANGPLTLGPQAPVSGRLAKGYDADVIAFDANPIDDITIWGDPDRVTHVWKAGEAVKAPA
jgi:imidazolonepropionase-like amidohydrolase